MDILLTGGSGQLYQSDGTHQAPDSAEPAVVCVLESDVLFPLGSDGDFVGRRVYLPFRHEGAIQVDLLVAVDRVVVARSTVHRLGDGRDEIVCPLAKRGTTIEYRVEVRAPGTRWSLEQGARVAFTPGAAARKAPAS